MCLFVNLNKYLLKRQAYNDVTPIKQVDPIRSALNVKLLKNMLSIVKHYDEIWKW